MSGNSKIYSVNGVELHVVEKGSKGQPVLIFLHGFPEFWYSWHHQIDYFASRGYRVLAPDQRGYNLSSKPGSVQAYQVKELVKDIAALIGATGERQVHLVGHDWGAAVAWAMAYFYPELIARLIIINVPHPKVFFETLRSDVGQMRRSWYIGFFQIPGLPENIIRLGHYKLMQNSLQKTSYAGTFTGADLKQYRQAWQQKNALRSMINWYRAAVRYRNPAATFTHKINMPTLILWGEKDKFLKKEMARKSLKYCQNGQLYYIPDATHWVHHEKPTLVNELIEDFIR
jgi:pimeloyl-ACP methyl ester carboxylesterase